MVAAVCVPKSTSLRLSLQNVKQAANHYVMAPFELPGTNFDR